MEEQADAYLRRVIELHQRAWQAKGQPGSLRRSMVRPLPPEADLPALRSR